MQDWIITCKRRSVKLRINVPGILKGNNIRVSCLVTTAEFITPENSLAFVEYTIQSVAEELPDDIYTLIVGTERLRAIRKGGEWLVVGRV